MMSELHEMADRVWLTRNNVRKSLQRAMDAVDRNDWLAVGSQIVHAHECYQSEREATQAVEEFFHSQEHESDE